MKVIEDGKICLYQYIYTRGSYSVTKWYASKESDTAIVLKTSGWFLPEKSRKNRKNSLEDMLTDKPEVYDKYKDHGKFSFNEIQDLIHFYNTGEEKATKRESGLIRVLGTY